MLAIASRNEVGNQILHFLLVHRIDEASGHHGDFGTLLGGHLGFLDLFDLQGFETGLYESILVFVVDHDAA